jgi:hypothetical protein
MVTVQGASKGGSRTKVLDGLQASSRVAELLGCCGLGLPAGAEVLVRCDVQLLVPKTTLADAVVAARGMVHVCAGEEGGMPAGPDTPGIFASPPRNSAGPEQGLVEELGSLLGRLSEDLSEMEGAFLRLELLARSGKVSLLLLQSH